MRAGPPWHPDDYERSSLTHPAPPCLAAHLQIHQRLHVGAGNQAEASQSLSPGDPADPQAGEAPGGPGTLKLCPIRGYKPELQTKQGTAAEWDAC